MLPNATHPNQDAMESKRKVCYAAERNKKFILEVLKPRLEGIRSQRQIEAASSLIKLLEVASGTGEHAAYFLEDLKDVWYQPTEMDVSMHESISAWLEPFGQLVLPPKSLDVNNYMEGLKHLDASFFVGDNSVDVVVCINMIHISPWSSTIKLFELVDNVLQKDGFLLTYGPYRVNGHMVESNIKFDESLKQRNSEWGVRDIEEVEKAAQRVGLSILETIQMPANNLCIIFGRSV
jgi:SAM-dependent methyltransferase